MRAVIVAAWSLFFMLCLKSALAADVAVGTVGPPFPQGWEDESAACVGGSLGRERVCDYSVGILRKDERMLLYIGKAVPKTDPHKGRWQIVDVLAYPAVGGDERLLLAQCQQDRVWDETLVAVVRVSERQWHTGIRMAFRANLTAERFERISSEGVRCANEGWGL